MTEDPAHAEERTRSAHRAIEIRDKRRRVSYSSLPPGLPGAAARCARIGQPGSTPRTRPHVAFSAMTAATLSAVTYV